LQATRNPQRQSFRDLPGWATVKRKALVYEEVSLVEVEFQVESRHKKKAIAERRRISHPLQYSVRERTTKHTYQ
jgi:hypothetical protein